MASLDTATFALVCLEITIVIFLVVITYVGLFEKERIRKNLVYLLTEGKLLPTEVQKFMQSKEGRDLLEKAVQQPKDDQSKDDKEEDEE